MCGSSDASSVGPISTGISRRWSIGVASRPKSVGSCWVTPSGCSTGGTGCGTGRWPGPPCGPTWRSCGSRSGMTLRRGLDVRLRQDGGDVPGVAGRRDAPVDVRPSRGRRADEQRRRAGAAARGDLPQAQRRDGQRGGEPVRGADAVGGGDLPSAGHQCAGLPDPVLPGPSGRQGRPFTASRLPRPLKRLDRLSRACTSREGPTLGHERLPDARTASEGSRGRCHRRDGRSRRIPRRLS